MFIIDASLQAGGHPGGILNSREGRASTLSQPGRRAEWAIDNPPPGAVSRLKPAPDGGIRYERNALKEQ